MFGYNLVSDAEVIAIFSLGMMFLFALMNARIVIEGAFWVLKQITILTVKGIKKGYNKVTTKKKPEVVEVVNETESNNPNKKPPSFSAVA